MTDQIKREELLKKAYELGFEYEKVYRGCSQCAIAAIQDTLNFGDDNMFKASTGLAAGGGLTGIGVCGGYVGSVLMLGLLCGRERDNFADPEKIRFKSFDLARQFTEKYIQEFGTIICRDIQASKFGRPYYIADPEEFQRFEDAGGHVDKCTDVVGRASRLAVEFILDQGLLDDQA